MDPPIDNPSITVRLDDVISCRLYQDTRPHCLETAKLQKGLVLLVKGVEVIEEGVGFGVPIIKYKDRHYFSSSAEISIQMESNRAVLRKKFRMDTVSRKRFGRRFYLPDSLYTFLHEGFHTVYTRKGKLTPVMTKLIELMRALGIDTKFQQVKSKGNINIRYACSSGLIEVEVQLSQLDRAECKEILLANEQGASFFTKYFDTNGQALTDNGIGAWEKVDAEEASLSNRSETVAFSLKKSNHAILFRGREKVLRRYSWVGFCYSLSNDIKEFKYVIRLAATPKEDLRNEFPIQKIDPHR